MTSSGTRPHIVILGLMGVGKSTTATGVAESLRLRHRDSDLDLQTLFGTTGREIAGRFGVDELHRLESAVLLGALAESEPLVISAAASVVEDPRCCEAMRWRATVIVLEAPLGDVVDRVLVDDHRRPIDRAELEAIASRRGPLFHELADFTLDARATTAELVAAIVELLS